MRRPTRGRVLTLASRRGLARANVAARRRSPDNPADRPGSLLAVVICAIALSLAYPVREYVTQRRQIDSLVAQQQVMLAQVKSLEAQQAKLSSPAYIEQPARQELDMCFPGTQCYIVEGGQPLISTAHSAAAGGGALVRQAMAISPAGGRATQGPRRVRGIDSSAR